MNTLVAIGTGVAYAYSAFVTLWPAAAQRWGLPLHVYFETSVVIIALILMGRWMEARAKRRTAAAIKALIGPRAEDRPRPARRRRGRRPDRARSWSATSSGCGRARRSRSTGS